MNLKIYCRSLLILIMISFTSLGVIAQVSVVKNSLENPMYLWSEKRLVSPDREYTKDQRTYSVDNPSMTPFWPDPKIANGTSVIIFPGGGYKRLAVDIEGVDVARWFNERGVTAFMVKYRMVEYGFPAPLLDAQRAMRLVRKNADAWKLNPNKIGVIGFSAGGHVAASLSTRFDFESESQDPLAAISARPDFTVLGYPVIDMEGTGAHSGSRKNLLGESPSEKLVHDNSLQFQVKESVPPLFIFHAVNDGAVPVSNSINFFNEVIKYNKNSELHLYQSNIHGVGMTKNQGSISSWSQAMELWLKQNQLMN